MIPVKDLAKYDKVPLVEEEMVDVEEQQVEMDLASAHEVKARQWQLTLVYIIFFAEAYVLRSYE